MGELIVSGKKVSLHLDGSLYLKHSVNKNSNDIYWKCRDCFARVTTPPLEDPLLEGAIVEIKKKGNSE